MGCSLSSNSHFQMGVTVMGFAEHFGHSLSFFTFPDLQRTLEELLKQAYKTFANCLLAFQS